MAFLKCNFYSYALHGCVEFNAVIPDNISEDIPTVYLLHGMHGDHNSWTTHTRCEDEANKRGVALMMPSAENSFYFDMAYGRNYYTYVSKEFVDYTRNLFKLSKKREKTFLCGLSMGGYGALKIALSNPEQYSAAVSMSGAVDNTYFYENDEYAEFFRPIFGPSLRPSTEEGDLRYLVKKLSAENKLKPRIFQLCGTDDRLIYHNREFKNFIMDYDFDYTYKEEPGNHVWSLWDKWFPEALDFLLLS